MSFDEFWEICAVKRGKPDARKAYKEARKTFSHAEIMERYDQYLRHKESWRQYCWPQKWLKKYIEDEYETPKRPEQLTADEWRKTLGEPSEFTRHYIKNKYDLREIPQEILVEYGLLKKVHQ